MPFQAIYKILEATHTATKAIGKSLIVDVLRSETLQGFVATPLASSDSNRFVSFHSIKWFVNPLISNGLRQVSQILPSSANFLEYCRGSDRG